jgi:hypothetical protein
MKIIITFFGKIISENGMHIKKARHAFRQEIKCMTRILEGDTDLKLKYFYCKRI